MTQQKRPAIRSALAGLAVVFSLLTPVATQAYADSSPGSTQWLTAPDGSKYPLGGWKSCAEARANAGVPILRGEPGFNPALDPQNLGRECA